MQDAFDGVLAGDGADGLGLGLGEGGGPVCEGREDRRVIRNKERGGERERAKKS